MAEVSRAPIFGLKGHVYD